MSSQTFSANHTVAVAISHWAIVTNNIYHTVSIAKYISVGSIKEKFPFI